MSVIIKEKIDRFFSYRVLGVCIVFSIYSIDLKLDAMRWEVTFWEYLLLALSDIHYMSFFAMAVYFFLTFSLFKEENELVVIRMKSRFLYYLELIKAAFCVATFFVLLHLSLSIVIGLGLDFEIGFTEISYDTNYIHWIFREQFSSAVYALLALIVYMVVGFAFITIIFILLQRYLKANWVIIVFAGLFILNVIGFAISDEVEGIQYVLLNHYILLHQVILQGVSNLFIYLAIILLIMLGFLGLLKRKSAYNSTKKKTSIFFWNLKEIISLKKIVYLSIWVIFLAFVPIVVESEIRSQYDLLFFQFVGHGIGYFDLMELLHMLLYNLVPIYFLCIFLEHKVTDASSILLIRLKSKVYWIKSILFTTSIFLMSYVILTIALTMFVGVILGQPFEGVGVISEFLNVRIESLPVLIGVIFVSKSLELMVTFLFLFILYCFTKSVLVSFLITVATILFGLISNPIAYYLPFGMSSLHRINELGVEQGIAVRLIIVILLGSIVVLYGLLRLDVYKKLFK